MNILDKIIIQKKNHYKYLEQKIKKTTLKKKVKPIFFQTKIGQKFGKFVKNWKIYQKLEIEN